MGLADIRSRFEFHAMNDDQKAMSRDLRNEIILVAEKIEFWCPDGREKSIALTKLEECLMWTNKSISNQ